MEQSILIYMVRSGLIFGLSFHQLQYLVFANS